jgi:hypothetical protein
MKIVMALRQFAAWEALAASYAAGEDIPPARYMPSESLPFFPEFLPACIEQWNSMFSVDFFTCRAELQRIARATLDDVADGIVLLRSEVLRHLPEGDFRLFFLDDDDWFAPDACARLACAGEEDVSVFPLFRLDAPPFTFVRQHLAASPVIGRALPCTYRYQTNNYGLHKRLTTPVMLDMLADHINASNTADRIGLCDAYHEVILSATNKTPVSVSVLMRIVKEGEQYRRHVELFVAAVRALEVPADADWLVAPIARTAALFEQALMKR